MSTKRKQPSSVPKGTLELEVVGSFFDVSIRGKIDEAWPFLPTVLSDLITSCLGPDLFGARDLNVVFWTELTTLLLCLNRSSLDAPFWCAYLVAPDVIFALQRSSGRRRIKLEKVCGLRGRDRLWRYTYVKKLMAGIDFPCDFRVHQAAKEFAQHMATFCEDFSLVLLPSVYTTDNSCARLDDLSFEEHPRSLLQRVKQSCLIENRCESWLGNAFRIMFPIKTKRSRSLSEALCNRDVHVIE